MIFDFEARSPQSGPKEQKLLADINKLLQGHDMMTVFNIALTLLAGTLSTHPNPESGIRLINEVLPKALERLRQQHKEPKE